MTKVLPLECLVQQDPLEAEGGSQQLAVSDVRKEKGIQSRSILQFTYGEIKVLGAKRLCFWRSWEPDALETGFSLLHAP